MSRLFYHVMQDNVGNLLFDVSGTMRLAGSSTLATIYGDEALTVIVPNPMTNHPSFGSFKCFLGAGDYDFHMAKAGYTFETLTGVQGHGTMAQQDASAVAITGGVATLSGLIVNANATVLGLSVYNRTGNDVVGLYSDIVAAGGTNRWALLLQNDAPSFVGGHLTLGEGKSLVLRTGQTAPALGGKIEAYYDRAFGTGLVIQPTADTGPGNACGFYSAGGGLIGSITTTGVATAYNTSSDGRLKEAIATLTGGLDVVRALRPVAFQWRADATPGVGFVAQEAQAVVPQAVTGDPDDPAPTMQMDYAKLVPYLIGACQTLAAQVEGLTARLAAVEGDTVVPTAG